MEVMVLRTELEIGLEQWPKTEPELEPEPEVLEQGFH
jgi:hypothetical protein